MFKVTAEMSSVQDAPCVMIELATHQAEDNYLQQMKSYLADASDDRLARKLVLEKDRFVLTDGILYRLDSAPQYCLMIAVPSSLKQSLMDEQHCGPVGGHCWEGLLSCPCPALY